MAAFVVSSLLLAVVDAARSRPAPGSGPAFPTRSEEGRRLRPSGLLEIANSLGATLDVVHMHRLEEDALVHVHHPVEQPPPSGPPGQPSGWASERDVVRKLLRMSFVCYGRFRAFSKETMDPIFADGESLYGPSVNTHAQEVAEDAALMKRLLGEFEGTYEAETGGTGIDASRSRSAGVHALEFTVRGIGKVLAFRGTASLGDQDNIILWILNWVQTKMSATMKHAWLMRAGLPWSKELEMDRDLVPSIVLRALFRAGSWYRARGFMKTMKSLAEGTKGLIDPKKVVKTGYWDFTKTIAEHVRKNLKEGEKLMLTGHSAGGTRAALVSMFFEQKYNESHRTVTFAAPGGQCFTRKFAFTGAALTDDVNPYVSHSQITDYAHPLDVFSTLDYGVGTRCFYGLMDIAESRARKYCEKIFGHKGPELIMAERAGSLGKDLANEFQRCYYFTHAWNAMYWHLMNDTYLKEDGTTDGGCVAVDIAPKDDPNMMCPTESGSESCGDELSCKSCQVSSASYSCYWSVSSGTCVSSGARHGKAQYIGPKGVCPETSASVAPGKV